MFTSCARDDAFPGAPGTYLAHRPVDEREHQQYAERAENESERGPEQPAVPLEREQPCQQERQCRGDERGDGRDDPAHDLRSLPVPRAHRAPAAQAEIDLQGHAPRHGYGRRREDVLSRNLVRRRQSRIARNRNLSDYPASLTELGDVPCRGPLLTVDEWPIR